MKKQTCWLMLAGTLLMGFTVFTRSFIAVPEDMADFLKGIGVAIIISAFFLDRKKHHLKTKKSTVHSRRFTAEPLAP